MRKPEIRHFGPMDRHGKMTFELSWDADYHPGHPDGEHRVARRGQMFHADPIPYIKKHNPKEVK